MTIFNDKNDIRQYVSRFLEGIEIENYDYQYDDLVDAVSCDFRDLIRFKGYFYGQFFDESLVSQDEFFRMLEQYEKAKMEKE